MSRELGLVHDVAGVPLLDRTVRVSAVDAAAHEATPDGVVTPTYSLRDQLFVDPHPLALPDQFDLDQSIKMTPQEVAVATSHARTWARIAGGPDEYALVLEDDVWFRPGFSRSLERVWTDLSDVAHPGPLFDILYLSYQEVRFGAEKTWVSGNVFEPRRGLWYLSGYVLSRRGAQRLLARLPIVGPVDLWTNKQFDTIRVYGSRRPIIEQRADAGSANAYSALPALTRIGVLNSETPGLFRGRPGHRPVFVFGPDGCGLSSIAMALSMLGYRCLSDVGAVPAREHEALLVGDSDRVFDAYVNVGGLAGHAARLAEVYPSARLIVVEGDQADAGGVGRSERKRTVAPEGIALPNAWGDRALVLRASAVGDWKPLCEFLQCVPPVSAFPECPEVGRRSASGASCSETFGGRTSRLRSDSGPWVAPHRTGWDGISLSAPRPAPSSEEVWSDALTQVSDTRWTLRDDTFAGNLALFRPSNFEAGSPARLVVRAGDFGVRAFGACALTTRTNYLYGRFEAAIRPPRVPGVVTGVFLHRDSPRQEIDLEFTGDDTTRLLTNVFYNPGGLGARFDYGYRGTPVAVDLGFDASTEFHRYAIEWDPCEVRWFVDEVLVHRRVHWDPTPVPGLPMRFHVNVWPTASRELAGRLRRRHLPAICEVESVGVCAGVGTELPD